MIHSEDRLYLSQWRDILAEMMAKALSELESVKDMTTAEFHVTVNPRTSQVEYGPWCVTTAHGFIKTWNIDSNVFLSPQQVRGKWLGVVHDDGAFLLSLDGSEVSAK